MRKFGRRRISGKLPTAAVVVRQNAIAPILRVSDISRSGYAEPMVTGIIDVVRLLLVLTGRQRALALENLAPRQQLALYRRTRPKPIMRWPDRLFWIGLRAAWGNGNRPWWSSAPPRLSRGIVAAFRGIGPGGRDLAVVALRSERKSDDWFGALANPLWGAFRIHGELLKLGFELSERTVSRLMPRRHQPPSQSWRTFLTNHLESTVAVDFFAVPTLTCRILFVFLVLAHDRRRILHVNVTRHPTSAGRDSSSARPSLTTRPRDICCTTATRPSMRRSTAPSTRSA